MTWGVRVSSGIHEIGADRWDELARTSSFYLSADWLLAWEDQGQRAIEVVTVVDERDRVVAAVPTFSEVDNPRYDLDEVFNRSPQEAPAARPWRPQLVGGGNSGYRGGVPCDPSLGPADRARVLRALLEAFFALAGERGCPAAAIPFLDRETLAELLPLAPRGVVALVCAAAARLDVCWPDFDGYVDSLSKPARRMARQDLQAFAEAGYEVVVDHLGAWIDTIAPLLGNVQARHESRSCEDAAAYLRLCASGRLDRRSLVFLACRSGRPDAFVVAYQHGQTLYPRVLGLDYEASRAHAVYFNTFFYTLIRHALEQGLSAIDLGLEAYEAKLRRGARLQVLWSLARLPGVDHAAAEAWNERQRDEWADRHGAHAGFPAPIAWTKP